MDSFDDLDSTEYNDPESGLLLDDSLPPNHRSGFVAVIGRPNVGKSTLMNHYLGQKIAIVSPKPQTTRNQLLGILSLPNSAYPDLVGQVIFIDTPGIHAPQHKLGEYLVDTAVGAIPESDVIVWLVDVTRKTGEEDAQVANAIRTTQARREKHGEPPIPVILALNKIDLLGENAQAGGIEESFLALYPADERLFISASRGDNRDALLNRIVNHLPPGPRYFPEEQVTDQQIRFIAAELIREAALNVLRQEVPHAMAVAITEFKPRHQNLTYISANLVLERKSQKSIVIGQKGSTLKKIGQLARPEIEALLDSKVYLDLWVKVRPKWRKKENELRWLGYVKPQ